MTRRFALLLIVLGFAAAIGGGAYWWHARSSNRPQASLQQRAQKASIEGRRFPRGLHYPTLSTFRARWGDTLQLDRWLGKRPMVVNVWASWCAPCRREVPLLQKVWAEHKDAVQFVGIDFRDKPPDAATFAHDKGMTYPSGIDPRGTAQKSLHIMGVPDTFFIDKQGRIVYERIGELTAGQLRKGLARIVKPAPR